MNVRANATITAITLLTLAHPGCGGYESSHAESHVCRAQIQPRSFQYTISDDVLYVKNGERMTRIADGDNQDLAIYGTWNVHMNDYLGKRIALDLKFEPDMVTAIAYCDYGSVPVTAKASSPAVITESTVEILELAESIEEIPAAE